MKVTKIIDISSKKGRGKGQQVSIVRGGMFISGLLLILTLPPVMAVLIANAVLSWGVSSLNYALYFAPVFEEFAKGLSLFFVVALVYKKIFLVCLSFRNNYVCLAFDQIVSGKIRKKWPA
ncbi:MAG: hypothetical protein AB1476_01195 [Candidatus Hadarchaeota archaeon]